MTRRSDLSKPAAAVSPALLPRSRAAVPQAVHDTLQAPGQPLSAGVRAPLERGFGQDFSHVRVHNDARAAASARAVNAAAYTVGRDIVFGAGRYAPAEAGERQLLAHELAHVAQQRGAAAGGVRPLAIGEAGSTHEAAADRAAAQVLGGARATGLGASGLALQRQPLGSDAPRQVPAEGGDRFDLAAVETIGPTHPKLVQIASAYQSGGLGHIEISADLSEAAQNGGDAEKTERATLLARMRQARDALQTLGVPQRDVLLGTPSAYSTSAHGQISVALRRSGSSLGGLPGLPGLCPMPSTPPIGPTRPTSPQGQGPGLGPAVPPAPPAASGPSLSDKLTLKYGPLTIELPKSLTVKLPIPIGVRTLVIELKAEVPAKFGLKIMLDGRSDVRISVVAGGEYDTDKKGVTGKVGLEIESVGTTARAVNPEETRTKITAAGAKLMKAGQEFSAATEATDKETKLIDIASALGEMYDAVDKAKAAAKPVPRWKVNLGGSGPLGGNDDPDPAKRMPWQVGITGSVNF